jgi:hypothetical protein
MDFGSGVVLTSSGGNDAYIAKLAGATGVALCAARYGDQIGTQDALSIAIARYAAGAVKDAAFVAGQFNSEMDFGLPNPLSNPGNATPWPYLLRVDHL